MLYEKLREILSSIDNTLYVV